MRTSKRCSACHARRLAQPFCDAWCEGLQVAAEFQGVQHAWFPNPVHKSRTAFEVKRGTLKQMLCQEHGIWLILVPHTVTSERMTSFLREALDESKHESWPPPGHVQYAYSRHQH